MTIGPQTRIADILHSMKYRGPNEDFVEAMNRGAFGLADNNRHYFAIRDIVLPQRFCFGGRIQGAIGATRQTTAFNCYVAGTIGDAIEADGGIMDRLKEAAVTSKLGGGIGYDFSRIRPKGDRVRTIETDATGPVSFMEYFNTVGLGIASSGHRRGAQMAILRVDHPDIEQFVRAKQFSPDQIAVLMSVKGTPYEQEVTKAVQAFNPLQGFNVSVGVTDEFMEAVYADGLFELKFGGTVYSKIRAVDLWQKIMRATWDWAEPGVFFLDNVNRLNNLYYCETIEACNPCGEQPLPPYGACLLGSWNLPKYLTKQDRIVGGGFGSSLPAVHSGYQWSFNFDQLREDIPAIVRALDNVIDKSLYPIPAQKAEALAKRRMGIGVMGLANAGEALGFSYGCKEFLEFEDKVLELICHESYRASVQLAKEKGPFPLFDAEKYVMNPNDGKSFIATLPDDIQHDIAAYGIRNSHLTSIAPTGTISLCADNVSGGIEPVFAYTTKRKVNTPDGQIDAQFDDYGMAILGVKGKLAADVTPQEHVDVLLTAQKHVDSAVSKTCNVTGATPWDEFLGIYSQVHKGGGKGCTTFNKDGRRMALLQSANESAAAEAIDGLTCEIDLETGRRTCE